MIKAVLDKVIIKREKESVESKSTLGLILLENSLKAYEKGKIVAVGDGDLNLGNTVFYMKNSGIEIEYMGDTLLVLELKDILAVIEGETHE